MNVRLGIIFWYGWWKIGLCTALSYLAKRARLHETLRHATVDSTVTGKQEQELTDKRPFDQRVRAPRPARRMNHAFKHLYRHGFDEFNMSEDPFEFLAQTGGLDEDHVREWSRKFPPLLTLSVRRQIYPVLQFLRHTLAMNQLPHSLPPQVFGVRLERILAPRHALLVHYGLPCGEELLSTYSTTIGEEKRTLFEDFLESCRTGKRFAALCRSWGAANVSDTTVDAMDTLMGRGLLAASRNELVNNIWPLQHITNITSADILRLLISHGAYASERDHRGATALHWAAGTGNTDAVQLLIQHIPVTVQTTRDGSTPLHWAAAGATAREFGTGGHEDVCHLLISQATQRRQFVNQGTLDGNSALMWASWSGSLKTVKLLFRHGADAVGSNRNGCTVAHWAASGGSLEACQYLANIARVDFTVRNHGGNTPLTHAVAFGHLSVVQWLRQTTVNEDDDNTAHDLALDFLRWKNGDIERKQILDVFEAWDFGGL